MGKLHFMHRGTQIVKCCGATDDSIRTYIVRCFQVYKLYYTHCMNIACCADDVEDVDECSAGTHNCRDALMTCLNRPGTFICQCQYGYHIDKLAMTCEGICLAYT